MVNLITYPMSLAPNGDMNTMEDGHDYYAQELALLCLTELGERPLVPDYGIEDPTFSEIDQVELESKVEMFGPPVTIETYNADFLGDGRLKIDIGYAPAPIGEIDEFDLEEDEYYDEDYGAEEDAMIMD